MCSIPAHLREAASGTSNSNVGSALGVAFDDGPLLTIDPVTPANGRVFVFTRSGNPGGGIVEGQVTQAAETLASASKIVAPLTGSKNGPAAFVGAFNDSYFTGSGTRRLYL